ncbi:MAG: hypothetical protein HY744_15135 [Deltaproteobacteria bacterium]|nr:hypothetical protein [Deltaproteobacteria bacterium]
MSRRVLAVFAVAALLLAARPAWSADGGVLIGPEALAPSARATLVAQIEQARGQAPLPFDQLARVREELPALDAAKRGRLASVTPILKSLGRAGLLPMLQELAVSARPRGELRASAWLAWRLALVEAVGMLRDLRAALVLEAIVDQGPSEPPLVQAAVEAFAKLGTDAAAAKLVALSRTAGPKQPPVVAGMGQCRRRAVAERLSGLVATRPAPGLALHAVRALGDVGSAWAWQTPAVAASGEEQAVRAAAAEALLGAIVAYEDPEVRRVATQAILVVDHPQTQQMIEARKQGASSELRAALDEVARRFARSPLR